MDDKILKILGKDLSEEECTKEKKHLKVMELFTEVEFPPQLTQFFDLEKETMLDEKIDVLTALKEGKTISEIPNFYNILEKYPNTDLCWD